MWSYARRGAGVPFKGSREQRAGSGVLYRLGQSTPHVIMPIRPRLSRPPRILIASDQNHALSDVVRSLGRRGYSVLRAGVWELVRQPLDVAELLGKLDRYVLVKVERDGVSRRDLVDEVTGLYSTHGLARRAGELILQAAQHNTSVACVAVAPDRHGPEAGTDGLDSLRGVARLLEASGRRSDAIGRIGPAEFAVVAAGVNRAGARQLANRLRDSVGVELRAGYDAVGSRRAGALEARGLLARAARALEMAKLEGKWVREARE